jgi:hypothetical protein
MNEAFMIERRGPVLACGLRETKLALGRDVEQSHCGLALSLDPLT